MATSVKNVASLAVLDVIVQVCVIVMGHPVIQPLDSVSVLLERLENAVRKFVTAGIMARTALSSVSVFMEDNVTLKLDTAPVLKPG